MIQLQHSWMARSLVVSAIALGTAATAQTGQDAGQVRTDTNGTRAAGQSQPAQNRQQLASDLIGMSVRGSQGNNIGQVEDLAIDMQSGQVRYAVLEFDRGFLAGERMVPIPLKELRMGADGNSLAYHKGSKQQLEKMAMNKSQWNSDLMRDKARLAKLDSGWGLPPFSGSSLVRANDLMDKEVQNKAGEHIGEIEDLVINMDQQKVNYAMLEFERSWLTPERTVAVLLSAFSNPSRSGDDLVMDVSKDRAREMKGLTREQMRNPDAPEVVALIERHFIFLEPASAARGTRATAADTKPETRSMGGAGASSAASGQK
jgi:sporulation protein YlmC with PRC-barrel domain